MEGVAGGVAMEGVVVAGTVLATTAGEGEVAGVTARAADDVAMAEAAAVGWEDAMAVAMAMDRDGTWRRRTTLLVPLRRALPSRGYLARAPMPGPPQASRP